MTVSSESTTPSRDAQAIDDGAWILTNDSVRYLGSDADPVRSGGTDPAAERLGEFALGMLPFAAILAIVAAGQTLVIQQGGIDLVGPWDDLPWRRHPHEDPKRR